MHDGRRGPFPARRRAQGRCACRSSPTLPPDKPAHSREHPELAPISGGPARRQVGAYARRRRLPLPTRHRWPLCRRALHRRRPASGPGASASSTWSDSARRSRECGSPALRSRFDSAVSVRANAKVAPRSRYRASASSSAPIASVRRPCCCAAWPQCSSRPARGVARRGEIERPCQAGLGAGHVDGQCPLPGEGEIAARGCLQLRELVVFAGSPGQLQSLDVVICKHVAEIVDALSSLPLDPASSGADAGAARSDRGICARRRRA